jgi:hypothetical protein
MPKSGMIMPILGAKVVSRRKSLADALFTKTQQRVLRVLFGQPERSFYASPQNTSTPGGKAVRTSGVTARPVTRSSRSFGRRASSAMPAFVRP